MLKAANEGEKNPPPSHHGTSEQVALPSTKNLGIKETIQEDLMWGMEISWKTLKEHRRSAHVFGEKKNHLEKNIRVCIWTTLPGLTEKLFRNNQAHLFPIKEIQI